MLCGKILDITGSKEPGSIAVLAESKSDKWM
jgi:hypothetical protein